MPEIKSYLVTNKQGDVVTAKRVLGFEFRPMAGSDWDAFSGAEEGTMIGNSEDLVLLLTPKGTIVAVAIDGTETEWAIV